MTRARVLLATLVLLAPCAARAQAYATEWLTTTSDPANRVNLAILGDGYTADAASQAKLATDANAVLTRLFSTAPWSDLKPAFTAKLIHVTSVDSGATNGSDATAKNTALGAYYGCSGVDRLICLNTSTALKIAAQHFPEYTFAIVVVNDTKYGGSGGTVAVVSTSASASYILVHELAHSVAHLADEYTTAYPGYAPCSASTDCPEPNATLRTDRARVKWSAWLDAATPVPTPSGAGYTGIGLFEGARYLTTGVYRPKDSGCIMRSSSSTYCSVCGESLVTSALGRVDLLDSVAPASQAVTTSSCQPTAFSVSALPVAGAGQGTIAYTWTVDGVKAANATASFSATLAPGSHTVSAVATYTTPLVRNDPSHDLQTIITWSVSAAACSGGIALLPATSTVPPHGQQQLVATGGAGGAASYTLVTNNSGASVDAAGHYTAGATGGVTDVVRVTDSAGAFADATIDVTAGVAVTPGAVSVPLGGAQAFSASGGTGAGFAWAIASNASGATIDSSGRYVAGRTPGVDLVMVSDPLGNVATATVSVITALTVSPAAVSLTAGASRQFTASGGSGAGRAWSIPSNRSGATIDASGLYTAGVKGGAADVVQVTDASGAYATATVSVAATRGAKKK